MTMRLMVLSVLVLGCLSLAASADVILFDDVMHGSSKFWKESGAATSESVSSPTASGTAAIHVATPAWAQAGLSVGSTVPAGEPVFTLKFYRTAGGGNFVFRHSGWTALLLSGSNADYWQVNGVNGGGITNNTWQTLTVDTAGLGLTGTINAFGVKGGSSGVDIYFDDVAFIPEPATLALLGLGACVLVRRRRA